MLKRMILSGLLAFAAVPALASDVAYDRKPAVTPSSTDEARAVAARRTEQREAEKMAQQHVCSCHHQG